MSKAYHFVKNFTFREVINLYAYGVVDPSVLSTKQSVFRLYRNSLRRIFAYHFFAVLLSPTDIQECWDQSRKTREDFDKVINGNWDPREVRILKDKYELLHETYFEPEEFETPDRPYSYDGTKELIADDNLLDQDPFGYYSQKLIAAEPSDVHFHEEYPLMCPAWVFNDLYRDPTFEYIDPEDQYSKENTNKAELKANLDLQHKNMMENMNM